VEELRNWLEAHGLGHYAQVLIDNELELALLPDLTDADLETLGLSLGARKRFWRAVANLETAGRPVHPAEVSSFGTGCPSGPLGNQVCHNQNWTQTLSNSTTSANKIGVFFHTGNLTNLSAIEFYLRARTAPTNASGIVNRITNGCISDSNCDAITR